MLKSFAVDADNDAKYTDAGCTMQEWSVSAFVHFYIRAFFASGIDALI
jgi:hypothetical protein